MPRLNFLFLEFACIALPLVTVGVRSPSSLAPLEARRYRFTKIIAGGPSTKSGVAGDDDSSGTDDEFQPQFFPAGTPNERIAVSHLTDIAAAEESSTPFANRESAEGSSFRFVEPSLTTGRVIGLRGTCAYEPDVASGSFARQETEATSAEVVAKGPRRRRRENMEVTGATDEGTANNRSGAMTPDLAALLLADGMGSERGRRRTSETSLEADERDGRQKAHCEFSLFLSPPAALTPHSSLQLSDNSLCFFHISCIPLSLSQKTHIGIPLSLPIVFLFLCYCFLHEMVPSPFVYLLAFPTLLRSHSPFAILLCLNLNNR